MTFSPDRRLLASVGQEVGTGLVWELAADTANGTSANPVHKLTTPALLGDLTFNPDGRRLVGISRDLLRVWEVSSGQEILSLRGAPQ